ncbi:MAG: type III-A CRISPR-associated RAMP protein Csm5 [Pseudomonadales bacterium]|nr:type III-A CRISPR-associated RAMP protein Csm5 [Pseudomonadales bacterium]
MNNFLQQEKCFITTLSPVHMGCGEDYYPTQYVIDDGTMYVFDEMQMSKALGSQLMADLAKLAETGDRALMSIQTEINKQKDKLKNYSEHLIPVASGVQGIYASRIGKTKQQASNKLEIQRTFYNPFDSLPVITGSGIKGAIRTAILDEVNKDKSLSQTVSGVINSAALQKELLDYQRVDEDPMRLLKFSDSSYHHADNLNATEVLFAASRKRMPREGQEVNKMPVMLECIAPWRSRSFVCDMALVDRTFAEKNARKKLQLPDDLEAVAAACNRYYRPKLEKELEFLRRQGYSHTNNSESIWSEKLRTLLTGELKRALDSNTVFLLRLGKHGGAEDKTLNGVRSIRIMRPRPQQPDFRDKTTEVRLAASNVGDTQNLMPFGWVLVELGEQALPETMAFIREMAEPSYSRLKQDADRHAQQQKMLAEQQAKEKEERDKREAEARAEAERVAALAAMSSEMRQIAELRERANSGEDRGKGPGCQLADDVRKLVGAAVDWQQTDKEAALEAVLELLEHLGINPKKNDKWKKRLTALKE